MRENARIRKLSNFSLLSLVVSKSSDQPIHLYDAYTGRVRATYRPFNALDEMESPTVVSFSPDGTHVYAAGFRTDRFIHVFDTTIPGRDSTILRLGKTRRSTDGQKGLVSAIAFSPRATLNHVFCVGTYAPGSIYVYDERLPSGDPAGTILQGVCVVGHGKGHSRKKQRLVIDDDESPDDIFSGAKVRWFQTRARGGVTQLTFSPKDDYMLYSASRRSDAVLAWDLRMLSGNEEYASCPIRGIFSYATCSDTNQRLEFDFDKHGRRLFVGGHDRCVRIYDVQSGKLLEKMDGLEDVVNGISYTSSEATSSGLLAVAVGARRFPEDSGDEHENCGSLVTNVPGSIELYKV
jgi:WD40 repeat protein